MNDDLLPELRQAVEQQLVSPQTKYVAKTLEPAGEAGMTDRSYRARRRGPG